MELFRIINLHDELKCVKYLSEVYYVPRALPLHLFCNTCFLIQVKMCVVRFEVSMAVEGL